MTVAAFESLQEDLKGTVDDDGAITLKLKAAMTGVAKSLNEVVQAQSDPNRSGTLMANFETQEDACATPSPTVGQRSSPKSKKHTRTKPNEWAR